MPIPEELLRDIERMIEEAEATLSDLEDTVADLREAGITAVEEEAELRRVRDRLNEMRIFYELQRRRRGL